MPGPGAYIAVPATGTACRQDGTPARLVCIPIPRIHIHMLLWRLLPGICVLCRSRTHRRLDLCTACEADLERNRDPCPRCAGATPVPGGTCPACLLAPPPYTRAVAPFLYAAPMSRLIHGLKQGNGLLEARILADLTAPAFRAEPPPDVIVPVPLTWLRRVQRGYNQAALLAARIARIVDIPVDYRSVVRVRHTAPQHTLDARARRRNLRGAYRAATRLAERDVAIVDDVLTTGATAAEVARTVLEAGAREVRVWAVARTPAT